MTGTSGGPAGSVYGQAPKRGVLRRVVGFFDSATKIIVAITSLIIAVGGAWAAITHFGSGGGAAAGQGSSTITAAKIDACESAHGLSQRHEAVTIGIGTSGFASCDWPAPRYADPDGFSEISVETVPGPGDSASSDATEIDRMTGPCAKFRLTYDAKEQGTDLHPIPLTLAAGSVTWMDQPGQPFTGDEGIAGPARNQVDFLRNDNEILADAACAA
jgi:hypothetical protein